MKRRASVLPLAATLLLVAACSESARSLEDAVADEPGVISVNVSKDDVGDDDIPFASIPMTVRVVMDADATGDEVLAVFDAYDDAIDGGDVTAVEVTLAGPREATLASGEDVHVTRPAIDDLVAAQADEDVVAYRREAYPVLPSLDLEIAPAGFGAVVAAADRYRGAAGLDSVTVRSGGFLLVRDTVNDDQRVTRARERLVRQVADRFQLIGATVAGRGPLELDVAAADARAVSELAARNPEHRTVGKVVVVPGAAGAGTDDLDG